MMCFMKAGVVVDWDKWSRVSKILCNMLMFRERMDMFKGIGIPVNDPFENFRKNRSQGYVSRMREKARDSYR